MMRVLSTTFGHLNDPISSSHVVLVVCEFTALWQGLPVPMARVFTLSGVDKHDNLIGRLMYVGADEQLVDLGEQIVDAGLAKVCGTEILSSFEPTGWIHELL